MRYKQNFNTVLKDLNDEPVRAAPAEGLIGVVNAISGDLPAEAREKVGKKLDDMLGKEQTLGMAAIGALLAPLDDEKNLGEQERMRRFELARRVSRATKKDGWMEFNTEERDLMKKLVGKRYLGNLVPPLIWELLEDAEKVKELEAVPAPTKG